MEVDGELKAYVEDVKNTIRIQSNKSILKIGEIMLADGDVPSYYESAALGLMDGESAFRLVENVFIDDYGYQRADVYLCPYTTKPNHMFSDKIKKENDEKRKNLAEIEAEINDLKKPTILIFLWALIRTLVAPALLFAYIYLDYLTQSTSNSMTFVKVLLIIGIIITLVSVSKNGFNTLTKVLPARLSMTKEDKQERFKLYEQRQADLKGIDYKYRIARQFEDEWYKAETERLKYLRRNDI